MKMRNWLAMSLLSGMAITLYAQRAVPPPPKPADSGPSLVATMKFIQDKLNDTGSIKCISSTQDTNNYATRSYSFKISVTKVVADPNQCRISLHEKVAMDGKVRLDADSGFPVRDIQDVVVEPFAQFQTKKNAERGEANIIITSTNPPLKALIINLPHGNVFDFEFKDADLADRVAKAFRLAVELCGDGN
jgi:hypothetical protein